MQFLQRGLLHGYWVTGQMHALSDIETAIGGVAGGQTSWKDVLKLLAERHPHARLALLVATPGTHSQLVDQAMAGFDEAYVKSYVEHFQYINTWTKTHFQFSETPQVFTTRDAAALPIQHLLLNTEFYHDWVKPQDNVAEGLAIMFGTKKNTRVALTCNVPKDGADEMLPQLEADFRALLNPVTSAVRARILLEETIVNQSNFELSLGLLNHAACILTAEGHLVFANEIFQELLAEGDTLHLLGNGDLHLKTDCNGPVTTIGTLLQRHEISKGEAFVIVRRGGGRPLIAHFVNLAGYSALIGQGQPRYMLLITNPERSVSLPALKLVCDYFSISTAQAKIVLSLAEGNRPADVAKNLGLSPHTVRNHIAAVMLKTGCDKTSDIVSLVKAISHPMVKAVSASPVTAGR